MHPSGGAQSDASHASFLNVRHAVSSDYKVKGRCQREAKRRRRMGAVSSLVSGPVGIVRSRHVRHNDLESATFVLSTKSFRCSRSNQIDTLRLHVQHVNIPPAAFAHTSIPILKSQFAKILTADWGRSGIAPMMLVKRHCEALCASRRLSSQEAALQQRSPKLTSV